MPEYDPQEQQLVKTLDARLIPILAFLYLCLVVDRSTQFHARETHHMTHAGLKEDLHLNDRDFVLSLVAYGIASIVFALPATFCFRKFGPARCFGVMVIAWGLVTVCSAALRDAAGLVVIRVIRGILQAGFLPGIMLYIVSFYTREEWAMRLCWVVSSATIAVSFLGVFADWGAQFDGVHGLQTWKWMFVSDGLISMAAGAVAALLLPSYPETAPFLTPADRVLAVARGHDGSEGGGHESDDEAHVVHRRASALQRPKPPRVRFDTGQLIEALADLRNWLFAGAFFFISVTMDVLLTLGPVVTATSFSLTSQFLQSHETDPDAIADAIAAAEIGTRHARIVSAVPYLLGGIVAFLCSWNSDRTGDRALHATIPLLVSSLGFAFLAFIPVAAAHAGPARYFVGLLPATAGVVAAFPCLLSYALDKAQGDTSRVTVAALTFSFGQAFSPALATPGSVLLPDATSASAHALGAGVCAFGIAFSAFCVLLIRWLYRREETQMWNKGPGLRRLLNDADEGKAWDVELSAADIFATQGKKKKGRRASIGFWSDRPVTNADSDWDLKEYASPNNGVEF